MLGCFQRQASPDVWHDLRIYHEVSEYDKLLSDARKRNRVFMEKLNFVDDR